MEDRVNALLVRHMETNWNTEHRYSGQSDTPMLTENGLCQAVALSRILSQYNICKVVCSDLRRALGTALILARPHGIFPVVDPRLREVSLGSMDGMTKREARARYPQECFSTRSPSYDFSELGGESRDAVILRHRAAFDEHVCRCGTRITLFVGHGTSLRTFLESRGHEATIKQGSYRAIWY